MPIKHPSKKLLLLLNKKRASFLPILYKNQMWDAKLFTYIQLSKSSQTLTIETSSAELSHESGFFVRRINPYVQFFLAFFIKQGMTSLFIQLRGNKRICRSTLSLLFEYPWVST
jgi:hypothetical protein